MLGKGTRRAVCCGCYWRCFFPSPQPPPGGRGQSFWRASGRVRGPSCGSPSLPNWGTGSTSLFIEARPNARARRQALRAT
eukprot:6661526-Pyramimonas_sp.AAC.1